MADAISLIVQGILIGVVIAMPVGPIALLTMKRTLQAGMWVGFATGMGAALADTIYGAVAAFGVVAISDFLLGHQGQLRLIGGAVLLIVGMRMLYKKWCEHQKMLHGHIDPAAEIAPEDPDDIFTTHQRMAIRSFASSWLLTMTNPITFIAFVTIMTNIGIESELHGTLDGCILVLGVLIGAALWWLSLAGMVAAVKHLISEKLTFRINVIAAIVLVIFAIYALTSGIIKMNAQGWYIL